MESHALSAFQATGESNAVVTNNAVKEAKVRDAESSTEAIRIRKLISGQQ
jgi:hypothetical protein